jgi:hypothetical protein
MQDRTSGPTPSPLQPDRAANPRRSGPPPAGDRLKPGKGAPMTEVNAPVLDTLVRMNEVALERSGFDPETLVLVRIAAWASTGAPPASYLLNVEAASEVGLSGRAGPQRPDRHRSGGRSRPRGQCRQLDCPGSRPGHRDRHGAGVGRRMRPLSGVAATSNSSTFRKVREVPESKYHAQATPRVAASTGRASTAAGGRRSMGGGAREGSDI